MPGAERATISILIPCYNEEANLTAGCLDRVVSYCTREAPDVVEILVIDDGSNDRSRDLIAELAGRAPFVRLLAEPHRGKSGAVIAGIRAAQGAFALFTDMDQATPIEELAEFRVRIAAGYDVIVGSRAGRAGAPIVRKLMAAGFSALRDAILDLGGVRDTQCGFKALRTDVANRIIDRLRVFRPGVRHAHGAAVTAGFDAELLFIARRLGARIIEVPVHWRHVGTRRVDPLRESWRGVRGLLAIRWEDVRGGYRVEVGSAAGSARSP
ncbi:MAG: glycosyltransferase [Chloroflexi bacterium]|nr:glycosyltransferase [Chloroflexota bacterium]